MKNDNNQQSNPNQGFDQSNNPSNYPGSDQNHQVSSSDSNQTDFNQSQIQPANNPQPPEISQTTPPQNPSQSAPIQPQTENVPPPQQNFQQQTPPQSVPPPQVQPPQGGITPPDQTPQGQQVQGQLQLPESKMLAQPIPQIPQATKSTGSKLKWIIIAIVALFVIIAGLIFANEKEFINIGIEKYYNAIGLEKLWRGYPKSFAKAYKKMNEDMDQVKSLHDESKMTFKFQVTGSDVNIGVLKKLPAGRVLGITSKNTQIPPVQGSQDSPTFTMSVNYKVDQNTDGEVKGDMNFNLSNFTSYLKLIDTTLEDVYTIDVDFISKDNKTYLKSSVLEKYLGEKGKKWFQLDNKGAFESGSFSLQEGKKDYSKLKSGKRMEDEKIDGENCYHYEFEASDPNSLSGLGMDFLLTPEERNQLTVQPKLDFWVSKKSHLIKKVLIHLEIEGQGAKLVIDYESKLSNFNSAISIEPPPQSEILSEQEYKKSVSSLYVCSIISMQYASCNEDDITRKEDLANIRMSLEIYRLRNNVYPKTAGLEKANDPNATLVKALVPKYLNKLPTDPKSGKYYAYQSDSRTYILSAVLDNPDDPQGKKVGGMNIYMLTPVDITK